MIKPTSMKKTCFLISPVGKQGTDHYREFREIFEHVIGPAGGGVGAPDVVIEYSEVFYTVGAEAGNVSVTSWTGGLIG